MQTTLLKEFPVIVECPVVWGEMDAFQHVNNTVYFRYFETARIAYFRAIAWNVIVGKTEIGPILKNTECTFRIPLTYPDQVAIGAKVSDIHEDRFLMEYRVVSERHQQIAADGTGLIVSFNYLQGKKAPLPENIREKIIQLKADF